MHLQIYQKAILEGYIDGKPFHFEKLITKGEGYTPEAYKKALDDLDRSVATLIKAKEPTNADQIR